MKEVLVVPKNILFSNGVKKGFIDIKENYFNLIQDNYLFKERNDSLENNPEFLQIIPYVWIVNPKTKKVFLYKRAPSKGDYKEERHLNKYSGGVGGHIDKDTDEGENPIQTAMIRELKEEVVMTNYPEPRYIGYIYSDSDMFNKVHFSIVGLAETTESIEIADGMASGDFYSINEVEKLFSNKENEIENWTAISWPFVKDYLQGL